MNVRDPFSLQDKTVLVVGASSGIGQATAISCSLKGARLVITGRDKEHLRETLSSLSGDEHSMILCDLNNTDDVEALASEVPSLDGIAFVAGIADTTLVKMSDKNDLMRVLNTNTIAPVLLFQTLLRNKKINSGCSIVLTSSVSGIYCGYIGGGLYGASKAALEGFMRAFALEVAPRKIRVNTVAPGMIATNLLKDSPISGSQIKADMERYPLGGYGEPVDVANTIVFLLSEASKWMTGSTIKIDGGYTLN